MADQRAHQVKSNMGVGGAQDLRTETKSLEHRLLVKEFPHEPVK